MDVIKGLFGAGPKQPPKLEDDHVYPTGLLDDTKSFRDMILLWTFCFNDVLDPDKLHLSLNRLLEVGDWRKFGGRLRINDNDKLELHVPREFSPERPAVKYSHQAFDMDINDHPLGKKFPKATDEATLFPGGKVFQEFARASGDPVNGSDLLEGDKPQLGLRIVSFNDATLVSLVWPHTLMDAAGLQALLQNWSLVVAGRESEVLPVLGARKDITYTIAESPTTPDAIQELGPDEELRITPKLVIGFKIFIFSMRFLWDLLWLGGPEMRTIFLPKKTMAKLKQQALEEVVATTNASEGEKPFVSEGDVISAWTTRIIASSEPRQLPVTILNAVNLRYRMKLLMESKGVFAQNLATASFTFLSPTTAHGPLGPIALAVRNSLVEQTTEPQLRAQLQMNIANTEQGGGMMLFGESNMMLVIISNWTKAKLTEAADFSAAVVRQGEATETRRNKLGAMTQVYFSSAKESILTKNIVVVKGKDHEGNYWIEGSFHRRTWLKVEEEIARLASGGDQGV
ncbi:hypothetical protein F66182_5397 [Fusarium sp. NRRL 66182]|nr:hypothetical protein F66182_5397 [Fusarium sp. NRRL 66182]